MLHGETDYLHDRANTMQSIESTIVELGGIFQQLAHMIKEQVIVLAKHSELPLKSIVLGWTTQLGL